MSSVENATAILANRYLQFIEEYKEIYPNGQFLSSERRTSLDNLQWMCQTIIENVDTYPVDKISRWLGFVQGVLASKGLIDVDTERNFSRPLFHAAYAKASLDIPPTKEFEKVKV